MRVKITDIEKDSTLYLYRGLIIGKIGKVDDLKKWIFSDWYYTYNGFFPENKINLPDRKFNKDGGIAISGFKYIEVPEPSAMSELAGWLNDVPVGQFDRPTAPKKLSWLQKIREYNKLADELKVEKITRKLYANGEHDALCRARSTEAMRDHYKALMTEALRDRDLHAKVADNWQAKLIDQNTIIGKCLKFSVGHNHVKIIIGNPATYCENFESLNKRIGWSVSLCSHKDVYNWKTGVIQSLDNLCNEKKYPKELRRDLRKGLAKKYPEIFEATK